MATPDALSNSTPLDISAAIAVEMEKLYSTVYAQFNQDSTFYSRLQTADKLNVSGRLVRIPILAQPGSTFGQFDPDGVSDSMGTGGGEQYDVGVCSPVFLVQSCQITKGAEWESDSKDKSIVDVFKESFRFNIKQFRTNIEALLASSDGTGILGTVTATPQSNQPYLAVSNANDFSAGCTYAVISTGGSNRGNIVVQTVDLINNLLYLSAEPSNYWPTGTAATDGLYVTGTQSTTYSPDRYTSATVSASLNGVPMINYQSSSGYWFGIPRSTWPGVLNPAYVSGGNAALTPQALQLLESLMARANGADAEELDDFVIQANLDQVTAWENVGLYSTYSTTTGAGQGGITAFNETGEGKERKDFLPKGRVRTMMGHELIPNIKARQNRIDLINFKYWFKTEVKPPSLFDIQRSCTRAGLCTLT